LDYGNHRFEISSSIMQTNGTRKWDVSHAANRFSWKCRRYVVVVQLLIRRTTAAAADHLDVTVCPAVSSLYHIRSSPPSCNSQQA